jgi:prolyl-tRNA synthetase
MGCYGIGVSRVVAAAIEQNHDKNGIRWPDPIAPFQVALVAIKAEQPDIAEAAEAIYGELSASGIDVLYDDRDARPGVKFADMELVGIPHRIVVSPKYLQEDAVEYKGREDQEPTMVPREEIITCLKNRIAL